MDPKISPNNPVQPGGQAAIEGEEPAAEKKHYEIDIFPDWCKACGICAAFCPRKCITRDEEGRPVISDAERCTGCRWCELHCPDFAICIKELVEEKSKEEAV
jgi:2-oxoglutarate ferredoxin oxidoreductase subunit delta